MAERHPAHQWPVTLTYGPVLLAPLRWRDGRVWDEVRGRNKAWLRPWEATAPPQSDQGPADYSGLRRALNAQARKNRMLPWLLFASPAGVDQRSAPGETPYQLAGQVTVSGIIGGSASLGSMGYWVDERQAGRGLIPTAVALATDYCFDVMKLHRMEVAIRPENASSLRVVEKLGFRPEGLRPRFLHIDGAWRDHLIFALNAEEVPSGLMNRWEQTRTPRT